jgi:hypothetical protein
MQEFGAVVGYETDEPHAARTQSARVGCAPSDLRNRAVGADRPDPINNALSTSHRLGMRRHCSTPTSPIRHARTCLDVRTTDKAREWFMPKGGLACARRGLDPDGDGGVCGWDPSVCQAAAAAARN